MVFFSRYWLVKVEGCVMGHDKSYMIALVFHSICVNIMISFVPRQNFFGIQNIPKQRPHARLDEGDVIFSSLVELTVFLAPSGERTKLTVLLT